MFCSLFLQALKEELDHEREKAEKENKVREMLCAVTLKLRFTSNENTKKKSRKLTSIVFLKIQDYFSNFMK